MSINDSILNPEILAGVGEEQRILRGGNVSRCDSTICRRRAIKVFASQELHQIEQIKRVSKLDITVRKYRVVILAN